MVNGLGVLGWGVGGIEAEAAMLGEPLSMLIPQVVGFRLTAGCREGATATDLVLTVTELLRTTGVVGKFVEYFGPGLAGLALADRATIGNMSPEYGATAASSRSTRDADYLRLTGRPEERVALVEAYCKEQACSRTTRRRAEYSQIVELDLGTVEPSLAGPRRPQDRVPLRDAKDAFLDALASFGDGYGNGTSTRRRRDVPGQRPDGCVQAPGPAHDRARPGAGRDRRPPAAAHGDRRARRRGARARARHGRDRRDHELHEHLEPAGDGRRRPAREEGGRARPRAQAVGEDALAPGSQGRDRLLRRPG